MKSQYVKDLTHDGKKVDTMFAVKFKKPPVDYKNSKQGKWFEVRLSDRTGEISAKYWGFDEKKTMEIYDSFSNGEVVSLKGTLQEYPKGTKRYSISIDSVEGALMKAEEGTYDISDFVATTSKDIDLMEGELRTYISRVEDRYMKALAESFLSDSKFMASFKKAPAAMEYHQNYIGGLLEHTLNVVKICDRLCEVYDDLDYDLTVVGAFLHDFGKISELDVSGTMIDVSHDGMLLGHIVIGYEMVSQRIEQIEGFPENVKLKVLHVILSHHGKTEYGSPKKPQLPEAEAVHYADECDAKLDIVLRLKREANTEDPWIWDKKIKGHVYLG